MIAALSGLWLVVAAFIGGGESCPCSGFKLKLDRAIEGWVDPESERAFRSSPHPRLERIVVLHPTPNEDTGLPGRGIDSRVFGNSDFGLTARTGSEQMEVFRAVVSVWEIEVIRWRAGCWKGVKIGVGDNIMRRGRSEVDPRYLDADSRGRSVPRVVQGRDFYLAGMDVSTKLPPRGFASNPRLVHADCCKDDRYGSDDGVEEGSGFLEGPLPPALFGFFLPLLMFAAAFVVVMNDYGYRTWWRRPLIVALWFAFALATFNLAFGGPLRAWVFGLILS